MICSLMQSVRSRSYIKKIIVSCIIECLILGGVSHGPANWHEMAITCNPLLQTEASCLVSLCANFKVIRLNVWWCVSVEPRIFSLHIRLFVHAPFLQSVWHEKCAVYVGLAKTHTYEDSRTNTKLDFTRQFCMSVLVSVFYSECMCVRMYTYVHACVIANNTHTKKIRSCIVFRSSIINIYNI